MSAPVVSVIMPTHNRSKYIGEAIGSVLTQEFTNLELIILDDGSTDTTEEIVRSFTDSRIRYYLFEKSGEISRLRNTGIDYSNGTFIAFLDSDDVWSPEKLSEQLRLFERYPLAGFGFCDVIEFRENSILRSGIYHKSDARTELVGNIFLPLVQNRYVIYPSSAIFKKECVKTAGTVNESLKPGETEFFTRLAYAYDCCISYKAMARIRKHEANSSDQWKIETVDEMLFCLKQLRSEGKIPNKLFRKMMGWYHYLGGMGYREKQLHRKARQEFALCVQYESFHVKAWIRWIAACLHSVGM